MTGLGEIAAIFGVAKKVQEILGEQTTLTPEEFAEAQKLFHDAQSIATQARKGIMMYPMLFSTAVREMELVDSIVKFQEVQYALFTLITAGLNPVSMKSVGQYVESTFGTEALLNMPPPESTDVAYELVKPSASEVAEAKDISIASMAAYDFGDENPALSLEGDSGQFDPESMDPADINPNSGHIDTLDAKDLKKKEEKKEESKYPFANGEIDSNSMKKGPTVIKLKLKIEGFQETLEAPVIVKGVAHLLNPDEMTALFEYAIRDKNVLHRWIQLTTGEIQFFKDFVFQIDQAERDTKMYTQLGRHPWYRELEQRKAMSKVKQGFNSFIGGSTGKPNILPTATIVCTKDELALSSKMSYKFLMANPGYINNLIDKLFLLGLIIVDPDMETVAVHYAGYREPFLYTIKELKSSSETKTDTELAKAMSALIAKM